MPMSVERAIESLNDYLIDIVRKEKKEIYGLRLLIYSRDTRKKLNDRTFTASNELALLLKLQAHIAKKRLMRQYTPKKVKLRFMETSTSLVPAWLFQKLEQDGKKEGKKLILDEDVDILENNNH